MTIIWDNKNGKIKERSLSPDKIKLGVNKTLKSEMTKG